MESAVDTRETFSPAEISAVTGASVKAIYKAIGERLPRGLSVQRNRQQYLTRWGAVCFAIDREMPKEVPLAVRRKLYASILEWDVPSARRTGHSIYVVNVKAVVDKIDQDLARYRAAMRLIVTDGAIQGGAATFGGTRILVHQIADLLAHGVGEVELREDYPRLTSEMIAAAPIYARAHPRRGRPRKPAWRRNDTPERRGTQRGV